jgi:Trk-type K+ transport system membrane component
VYTNLFPSTQTWWLAGVLVILSGIDWTAFELLNRTSPVVTDLPMGYRVVDGLFQSFAVRSSGFCVIWISSLAVGLQALYVMMMYISAFPVTMAIRNSNVYEERSLGIYAEDVTTTNSDTDSMTTIQKTRLYFLREQMQRQLGHDLWFITICIIIIIIIETAHIVADPINYSVFNIIFEVVSAYGCVGLSIGYPTVAYAFSGTWHRSSKFVLCVMMLRGRHRGLPVEIDRAIQLPGEGPEEREEGRRGDEVNYRI